MRNQRHWSLCLLLAALGFAPIQHSQANQLSNANFQEAINLWFTAESNATLLYGHIRDWNVSGVTDMAESFKNRANFNEDISDWDVINVTSMYRMFLNASSFNQPIGDWNVSSVTNMGFMFKSASKFNQAIENWNVSNVTSMHEILAGLPNSTNPSVIGMCRR